MSPSTAPHKATDTAIAVISRAVDLLGTLRSIPDVLDLRGRAAALAVYARAKKSDELYRKAQAAMLWCDRRAGEMLREMRTSGEFGRGRKSAKLADFGIEEHESLRWQAYAAISREQFASYIERAENRTQSGLLELAKGLARPKGAGLDGYAGAGGGGDGGEDIAAVANASPASERENPPCPVAQCPACGRPFPHKLMMLPTAVRDGSLV